jgi:hypothetical protein
MNLQKPNLHRHDCEHGFSWLAAVAHFMRVIKKIWGSCCCSCCCCRHCLFSLYVHKDESAVIFWHNLGASTHVCYLIPWDSWCHLQRMFLVACRATYALHPWPLHYLQIGIYVSHLWVTQKFGDQMDQDIDCMPFLISLSSFWSLLAYSVENYGGCCQCLLVVYSFNNIFLYKLSQFYFDRNFFPPCKCWDCILK